MTMPVAVKLLDLLEEERRLEALARTETIPESDTLWLLRNGLLHLGAEIPHRFGIYTRAVAIPYINRATA